MIRGGGTIPLFLFTAYAKSAKDDLAPEQLKRLSDAIEAIRKSYGRRR